MQLSDNTVKILDGAVNLVRRSRSSKWYAHYKIGSEPVDRKSTKESDLDKAKVKARDMYLTALYRARDGRPAISKKFCDCSAAMAAIKRL